MPLYKNNLLDSLEVTAKRRPVIVNDINDPRLKAYNDSLSLYNIGLNNEKELSKIFSDAFYSQYSKAQSGYVNKAKAKMLRDDINRYNNPSKYENLRIGEGVDTKKYTKNGIWKNIPEYAQNEGYLGTRTNPATLKNLLKYEQNNVGMYSEYLKDKSRDINGLTAQQRVIAGNNSINALKKQIAITNRTGYQPKYVIPNGERPVGLIYTKPVQPVVYQKQQVQQVIQPVVQSTQQVPVQQENWTPIQNTIMYNMNGKTMFSTSDKINELFKSDIDKMTKAGVSQETIYSILRQKYQIKERNITYTPSAATQKATGKTTEELTHSKNPLTRKRAIFAQNAKKWKHQDGGELLERKGAPFTTTKPDIPEFPYNGKSMYKGGYNINRALELYKPDNTGHLPSVDSETGE